MEMVVVCVCVWGGGGEGKRGVYVCVRVLGGQALWCVNTICGV